MLNRRTLLITGLAALPVAVVTADDLLFGRRIRPRCALPPYPYPHDRVSNPVSIGGLRMIRYRRDGTLAPAGDLNADGSGASGLVSTAATGESVSLNDPRRGDDVVLKTFQMEARSLENDHCRISQVTVTVSSRGDWILHLVAEQNPALVGDQRRPPFEVFKRNQFVVDLRSTGLMTTDQSESQSVIAKPEYPSIPRQEFWINKHQISRVQRQGKNEELATYFPVMEQLEVHFSYR